jgi:hypothetical protein
MASIQVQHARIEELRRVHNFKALCAALRVNDPKITVIEGAFPVGYGHCLGGALQANKYVTSCKFNLSSMVSGDEIGNELDPLLHYLSNSTVLCRVYLHVDYDGPDVCHSVTMIYASLIEALSANTRMEELRLGPVIQINANSFNVMAMSCKSLKKLDVARSSFNRFSPELIAQCFGALRSLEHLTLQNGRHQEDSDDIAICILRSVCCLPKLKSAAFEFGKVTTKEVYSALNSFVIESPSLSHLEFEQGVFDSNFATYFAVPNRTASVLRSLKVDQCVFDTHAAQALSVSVTSGVLIELDKLHCTCTTHMANGSYEFGKHIGTFISCSSVTSLQLDMLSAEEAEDFFGVLRHATKVKLTSLKLYWYIGRIDAAWHALVNCIPFLVHLRELHTVQVPISFAALLLDALRQNGSLHVMKHWKNSPAFNNFDVSRICAYGQRNESLPMLLGPSLSDKSLFLFPRLCSVARHLSHMGANFTLIGLLYCDHCIGSHYVRAKHTSTDKLKAIEAKQVSRDKGKVVESEKVIIAVTQSMGINRLGRRRTRALRLGKQNKKENGTK